MSATNSFIFLFFCHTFRHFLFLSVHHHHLTIRGRKALKYFLRINFRILITTTVTSSIEGDAKFIFIFCCDVFPHNDGAKRFFQLLLIIFLFFFSSFLSPFFQKKRWYEFWRSKINTKTHFYDKVSFLSFSLLLKARKRNLFLLISKNRFFAFFLFFFFSPCVKINFSCPGQRRVEMKV